MTAANVNVQGTRRLIGLAPAGTSEVTMFEAADEKPVVVAIHIANLTSSAADATVKWGNGATDYALIATHSIAARAYINLPVFLPLPKGGAIKVKSGTGDALAFTLAVLESSGAFSAPP